MGQSGSSPFSGQGPATDAIGSLEFNLCCRSCGGGNLSTPDCACCPCTPQVGKGPDGPRFKGVMDAGFGAYLAQAEAEAKSIRGCCGPLGGCIDPFTAKERLEFVWLPAANAFLASHNITCKIFAWVDTVVTPQGVQRHPHLMLSFYENFVLMAQPSGAPKGLYFSG